MTDFCHQPTAPRGGLYLLALETDDLRLISRWNGFTSWAYDEASRGVVCVAWVMGWGSDIVWIGMWIFARLVRS